MDGVGEAWMISEEKVVILQALQVLYQPNVSMKARRQADQRLQDFQRSAHALPVALHVLQHCLNATKEELTASTTSNIITNMSTTTTTTTALGLGPVVVFFFAQTLYEKCIKKFPEQHSPEWLPQLVQAIWAVYTAKTVVDGNLVRKLALTLVALCLKHPSLCGHESSSLVQLLQSLMEVSDQVSQLPSTPHLLYRSVLVLCMFPEEFDNNRISINQERRTACVHLASEWSDSLFSLLDTYWNMGLRFMNQSLLDRDIFFKCMENWIEETCMSKRVLDSPILQGALQSLGDPTHTDAATSLVREVVKKSSGSEFASITSHLIKHLIGVGHVLLSTSNGIPECLVNMSDLLAETSISFQSVLFTLEHIHTESLAFALLHMLTQYCRHGPLDALQLQFEFWKQFQQLIVSRSNLRDYDRFTFDFISIVIERSKYPTDYDTYDEFQQEEFAEFRNGVRSLLRDLVQTSNATIEGFLSNTLSSILSLRTRLVDNPNEADRHQLWRDLEADLHSLTAVAKCVDRCNPDALSQMLTMILALQEHPLLCKISCLLVGVLATWLARHPAILPCALEILKHGFRLPEFTSSMSMRNKQDHVAAVATLKICEACRVHDLSLEWIRLLHDIYHTSTFRTPSDTLIVHASGQKLILGALCAVIQKSTYSDAQNQVFSVGEMIFQCMHERGVLLGRNAIVALGMEHLTILCEALQGGRVQQTCRHPVVEFIEGKWPFLTSVLHHFIQDENIMESMTGAFCALVSTAGAEALPLCSQAVQAFLGDSTQTLNFQPCFVALITAMIPVIPESSEASMQLGKLLSSCMELLQNLALHPERKDQCLDGLARFMHTVGLCGKINPAALLNTNILESMLELTFQALQNPSDYSDEAFISHIFKFYQDIAAWYARVDSMPNEYLSDVRNPSVQLYNILYESLVESNQGSHMLRALAQFLILTKGHLANEITEDIFQTFFKLCASFNPSVFKEWWMNLMQQDVSFPRAKLSFDKKEELVDVLVQNDTRNNFRKFRRVMKTLLAV